MSPGAAAALLVAVVVAELLALAAALRGARRWRAPLVLLLAFALASDVVIVLGRALLLDGAARPFVGLPRAWYALETALVVAWPCALAGVAWVLLSDEADVWRERAICGAIGAWLGLSVGLAGAYPYGRRWAAAVLLALELAAVVVGWAAYARGWRARVSSERPRDVAEIAILLLVATETAVATIGPFARSPFADWHLARVAYLLGFAAVALIHVQRVRAVLRM